MITVGSSEVRLEPISRLVSLCSVLRAIGTTPASTLAPLVPSAVPLVLVKLVWEQLAGHCARTSRLRGRSRVLFFATAGGAFANIQTTFAGVQSSSTTQAGWTAGAGVEWAFADNWTAKAEYLYIDLGTWNGNCTAAVCGGAGTPLPLSIGLT